MSSVKNNCKIFDILWNKTYYKVENFVKSFLKFLFAILSRLLNILFYKTDWKIVDDEQNYILHFYSYYLSNVLLLFFLRAFRNSENE